MIAFQYHTIACRRQITVCLQSLVFTCLLYLEISCQVLPWEFCNFTCEIRN